MLFCAHQKRRPQTPFLLVDHFALWRTLPPFPFSDHAPHIGTRAASGMYLCPCLDHIKTLSVCCFGNPFPPNRVSLLSCCAYRFCGSTLFIGPSSCYAFRSHRLRLEAGFPISPERVLCRFTAFAALPFSLDCPPAMLCCSAQAFRVSSVSRSSFAVTSPDWFRLYIARFP